MFSLLSANQPDRYFHLERISNSVLSLNRSFDSLYSSISDEPNRPEIYPDQQEQSEFIQGRYLRRFHLENYRAEHFLSIGIVSKTSRTRATFYGWTNRSKFYRAGVSHCDLNIYESNFIDTDTLTMILDCDQQTISLLNRRTKQRFNLIVDLKQCPLPWILNVSFRAK